MVFLEQGGKYIPVSTLWMKKCFSFNSLSPCPSRLSLDVIFYFFFFTFFFPRFKEFWKSEIQVVPDTESPPHQSPWCWQPLCIRLSVTQLWTVNESLFILKHREICLFRDKSFYVQNTCILTWICFKSVLSLKCIYCAFFLIVSFSVSSGNTLGGTFFLILKIWFFLF